MSECSVRFQSFDDRKPFRALSFSASGMFLVMLFEFLGRLESVLSKMLGCDGAEFTSANRASKVALIRLSKGSSPPEV